jgi:hypothetical protein
MRALLLLFASTLAAADFSGTWIGQVPARGGEFIDIAFQIVQTGDGLSGKLYGDYKSSPIVEGKAAGDGLWFVVNAQEQAGNQINQARLRFEGTLRGGEIEMTRQRESATNAGNSGVTQSRGNSKVTFKLKRLL